MPAYNFKPQFVSFIESGDKTQTIRAPRKRPTVKGDRFVGLVGARTKQCRRIIESTVTCMLRVYITEDYLQLAHRRLSAPDADRFAHADGFPDFFHMRAFFRQQHGLPFRGECISWRPPAELECSALNVGR